MPYFIKFIIQKQQLETVLTVACVQGVFSMLNVKFPIIDIDRFSGAQTGDVVK